MSDDIFKFTLKLENKVTRFLHDLLNSDVINNETIARSHLTGSYPRILLGLPKIHKINGLLRPILSYSGCHNLKLSQYAVKLLQPYVNQ